MPSLPPPMVSRSNISVVSAVPQPPFDGPDDQVLVEHDVVEEDLVELGVAGDLAQAAHRDALGVHRHDEHRQALVLVHVRVRAREQEAEGGELGVGRPDLLAVELPRAVVLLDGAALDAGEVGARCRLGEELAPHLVGVEHRREVALLLLLGAVGDDRRAEHADADRIEDSGDARARLISWLEITCSSGPRPWPPYSFGQVIPTKPPSASWRCQARWAVIASSSSSMAPSPRRTGASSLCSSSHARTLARYSAWSGLSFKSKGDSSWLTGQSTLREEP